ncbi:MAG: phosphatidylglycerophosphatase A [Endomicrobium sp.]|jgi:phosphatidylglycerophosphatase A|nr:phosphatidylglycerophosphatase A [Endomicrobium sp.]
MRKIILFFSSVCGAGYIKYAPGTFGSLAGILLWAFFIPQDFAFQAVAVTLIFFVSVFFSSLAERIYDKKDDQRIVIDEVAGVWLSAAFLPKTVLFLVLAFILFRIFDVRKPLFIKKLQKIKGGLGITVDDIAAGFFVNIILQGLNLILKW